MPEIVDLFSLWPFAAVTFAAVLAAGGLLLVAVRLTARKGPSEEELAQQAEERRAVEELRTRLALAEDKAARLPDLEARYDEARLEADRLTEELAGARTEIATLTQARDAMTESRDEARSKSGELATLLKDAHAALDKVRMEKAGVERLLGETETGLKSARERLEEYASDLAAKTQRIEELAAERGRLREDLTKLRESAEQEQKALTGRIDELKAARDEMKKDFQALSAEILKSHGETFKTQNKEQIDVLLTPLRDKIKEFQDNLTNSHRQNIEQHAALKEQILHLNETSKRMSVETENLTRALKGKVQTQGAWGEMILETILQRSGLREGEEYQTQVHHVGEEGNRLRPDVLVNLPNGERIVIDSKVSLKDFEAYVNAEDESERAQRLAAHAASVKSHVKLLGGKDYAQAAGGKLDFVLMFVPIESALAAANGHDPELVLYAMDQRVALVTPATLITVLKTVAAMWKVERQNQNAAKIAARAGALYDKFVGFAEELKKVGVHIERAQTSYDGAVAKLSSGRGNLVRQVEMLKDMGAETGKQIPADLLEDDAPLLGSDVQGEAVDARPSPPADAAE